MKFASSLKTIMAEKAGMYLFDEGSEANHIALVKDGEFEIVKRNLDGIDQKVLDSLKHSNVKNIIAKKVLLLRGRKSIYSKTNSFLNQIMNDKSKKCEDLLRESPDLDLEELAFHADDERFDEIAMRHAIQNLEKQRGSLHLIQTSLQQRYKDIVVTIIGQG